MRDHREHVLVLAEIRAAEKGFRGELDTGVAQELGIDVETYRAYRSVCGAIDDYELRNRGHEVLAGIGQQLPTELATADDLIDRAMELHRSWRGATGWHPDVVSVHARRILATALTLKSQIERRPRQLGSDPSQSTEPELDLGR